jgi:2-oxoisovalerate dehydrogenase E1 component
VINFPISEALIVGFASGVALRGNPVIAEIMFSDFLGLAFDQLLNHASKFHHMYAGKVDCRMIIRTPTGGRRGYGATHSQAMEKFFGGIPGLHVLLLHHRCHWNDFYESLSEKITGPALVFENKSLYGWFPTELPRNYFLSWTDAGTCRIARASGSSDLTIVAFGETGLHAEETIKLLEQEEIHAELLLPLVISELDLAPVIASLRTTAKLIVVEEGTSGYSLSSELISSLHGKVQFEYRKVCSPAVVIPAASDLESEILPDTQKILSSCLELFDE